MIQALPKNTGVFEEVIKQNSPMPTNQFPPTKVSVPSVLNVPSTTDIYTTKEAKIDYEKNIRNKTYKSSWKTHLRISL